jgi:hypothetical protein
MKLSEIIKGTFLGLNHEGSSKRMTAFFFSVVLVGTLTAIYEYCFYLAVIAMAPTPAQMAVVKMYESIHYSLQLTIWMLLGLATVETITNIIRLIRGKDEKSIDNDPK